MQGSIVLSKSLIVFAQPQSPIARHTQAQNLLILLVDAVCINVVYSRTYTQNMLT